MRLVLAHKLTFPLLVSADLVWWHCCFYFILFFSCHLFGQREKRRPGDHSIASLYRFFFFFFFIIKISRVLSLGIMKLVDDPSMFLPIQCPNRGIAFKSLYFLLIKIQVLFYSKKSYFFFAVLFIHLNSHNS